MGLRALWLLAGAAASCATPQEAAAPSLRGLSVRGADSAWASGSGGTILRTRDGVHWERIPPPPGAEQLDFRDLEADGTVCLLMAAGPGSASGVWSTRDAGKNWEKLLDCPWPEGFFDAIADSGPYQLLVGDPVDGALMILRSEDDGRSWKHLKEEARAHAVPGEVAFAASGTSVVALGSQAWIGTGGAIVARVWRSEDAGRTWAVADTPLFQGRESAGIFSLAIAGDGHGVIVGGDYLEPDARERTAAWTADGGRTWTLAATPPGGYRSCVQVLSDGRGERSTMFLCTGPNGTDVSWDLGRNWEPYPAADGAPLPGFHAVSMPFLAGSDGRIQNLWARD